MTGSPRSFIRRLIKADEEGLRSHQVVMRLLCREKPPRCWNYWAADFRGYLLSLFIC